MLLPPWVFLEVVSLHTLGLLLAQIVMSLHYADSRIQLASFALVSFTILPSSSIRCRPAISVPSSPIFFIGEDLLGLLPLPMPP
jgi:hypothetical protein